MIIINKKFKMQTYSSASALTKPNGCNKYKKNKYELIVSI